MFYNVSRFYSGTGFRFAIGYLLPFLVTDTYQTPERNGMNCSAGCRVRQAASFPADSPPSPTVDHVAPFIIFANYPFVSPTTHSVAHHAIQNTVTQVNAVIIRVMSSRSKAGGSVLKSNGIGSFQKKVQ